MPAYKSYHLGNGDPLRIEEFHSVRRAAKLELERPGLTVTLHGEDASRVDIESLVVGVFSPNGVARFKIKCPSPWIAVVRNHCSICVASEN